MAANLQTATSSTNNHLFAAADLGTNSFKLLIVHFDPTTNRFLPLHNLKHPLHLNRHTSSTISPSSELLALDTLRKFHQLLISLSVHPSRTRLVATSALREAPNQSEFVNTVRQTLGLEIDVISGEEEARLIYKGVLQFHPVFNKTVLNIDIGGGSTEFVIGREGKVIYANSLRLGHLGLTEEFVEKNEIGKMREHVRTVILQSGIVERIGEIGFEVVTGSSGTIRAIENVVFNGHCAGLVGEGYKLDWRFRRVELGEVVGKLSGERGGVGEKGQREGFSKRRSEFIVAGAVLLEEIFGMLGIEEMEVSGYALGEGVVAELLAGVLGGDFDLNGNLRWRSVVRLAARFNDKKRMKSGALCAGIAKEMFEGLRKWNELGGCQNKLSCSLNDRDLEYLEAACLLHNIGIFSGKKGYHRQSYRIIMNGDLQGYDTAEVEMIALLARRHRKKFPKLDHHSLHGFTEEVKQKFRILCVIIRVSALVQQYLSINSQVVEFSHFQEGFKLSYFCVFGGYLVQLKFIQIFSRYLDCRQENSSVTENILGRIGDHSMLPGDAEVLAKDIEAELTEELELFRTVFQQKLVVVRSSTSKSTER